MAEMVELIHGAWCEVRDDRGDYPSMGYKCSNCGNAEGDISEKYCFECGAKMDIPLITIPNTKCRLCKYSPTGYEKDCFHEKRNGTSCMFDGTGKWQRGYSGWVCSLCEGISPERTKYCPHCGKEMEAPYVD